MKTDRVIRYELGVGSRPRRSMSSLSALLRCREMNAYNDSDAHEKPGTKRYAQQRYRLRPARARARKTACAPTVTPPSSSMRTTDFPYCCFGTSGNCPATSCDGA